MNHLYVSYCSDQKGALQALLELPYIKISPPPLDDVLTRASICPNNTLGVHTRTKQQTQHTVLIETALLEPDREMQ